MALALPACTSLRPAPAPSHHFMERNQLAVVTVRDTSILYEGQLAPHIFLADGLPAAYHRVSSVPVSGAVAAWRVFVTPMFRIRQLADSSAAVRTPSFIPRVAMERTWVRPHGERSHDDFNAWFSRALVSGLRLSLTHHSNGQAGCFRDGFEPVDERANDCRPRAGADTTLVRVNRADGDFSTTFLTLLYHLSLRNGNDDYDLATHMLGFAASGDWHLPGVFGAFSDEQRELYGSWRVRLQAEGMRVHGATCVDSAPGSLAGRVRCALRGRSRLALEGELAPRHPGALSRRLDPAVKPYRISAELSHTFDALLRTGVFVKLHDGQDYYNIGFVNRRRVMTVGLVLDASGADRIGKTIVAP